MFPNIAEVDIEICMIDINTSEASRADDAPKILVASLILELPEVKEEAEFFDFYCDVQPPPFSFVDGDRATAMSDPPSFQSLMTEGLIVFNFCVHYFREDRAIEVSDVRFVAHKRALLELLASSLAAAERMAVGDSEAGSDDGITSIPWSEWGPSRTRWFDVRAGSAEHCQLTWGQRVVTIKPLVNDNLTKHSIYVYNFNPAAVSAATATTSNDAVTSLDPLQFFEDDHPTASVQAFKETVWSQLPYVKSESPFLVDDIRCAVMDGDRIVLFRVGFCYMLLG